VISFNDTIGIDFFDFYLIFSKPLINLVVLDFDIDGIGLSILYCGLGNF
jgi:hypothetical protein